MKPAPEEYKPVKPNDSNVAQDTPEIQEHQCELCGNVSPDVHEETGKVYQYACADQSACETRREDMLSTLYRYQFLHVPQKAEACEDLVEARRKIAEFRKEYALSTGRTA